MARYSRSLLAGMFLLGSTGEAVMLDDAESRDVLRVAAEAAAPEKVLIAGVGRESVKETVELAEAAARLHYDAVLVRTPTYYASQMSPAAVLHYFRSVADRSPLPVLLYNIPRCVPYDIPVELISELAAAPQHHRNQGLQRQLSSASRSTVGATRGAARRTVTVTPIFEAVTARMLAATSQGAGSFVSAGDLQAALPSPPLRLSTPIKTRTKEVGFQVLTGSASILLDVAPGRRRWGHSGLRRICSRRPARKFISPGRITTSKLAEEKQQRIAGPGQRIVGQLGISGLKYACDFNGYYGGRPRSPLIPLTANEKTEIESLLAGIRN